MKTFQKLKGSNQKQKIKLWPSVCIILEAVFAFLLHSSSKHLYSHSLLSLPLRLLLRYSTLFRRGRFMFLSQREGWSLLKGSSLLEAAWQPKVGQPAFKSVLWILITVWLGWLSHLKPHFSLCKRRITIFLLQGSLDDQWGSESQMYGT